MTTIQGQEEGSTWTLRAIRVAMAMPGARVDRAAFLRSELRAYCAGAQVGRAIEAGPSHAGISPEQIDKIADSIIKSHTVKASALSFAAGLPGGLAMAATIPVDIANYYWHTIVLAQKLAYLYGWPDLMEPEGELDEETEFRIVLLLGGMMGASQANKLLTEISKRFAEQTARRLPRYALTKTAYYPLVKTILKWLGVSITKQSFAKGVSKVIPFVGGVVSGSITLITLRAGARTLKSHLRTLSYNQQNTQIQNQ